MYVAVIFCICGSSKVLLVNYLISFFYYQDFARVDLGPRQALDRLWYNGVNKRS